MKAYGAVGVGVLVGAMLLVSSGSANASPGTTERVSVNSAGNQGNGASQGVPAISADGRYVVFVSDADNLVPGDTNSSSDIFVHDRLSGVTERVSVDSSGNEGNGGSIHPAISANGLYVAFSSLATNLVAGDTNGAGDVFLHDRETGSTERVSVDSSGNEADSYTGMPAISADGRYVAFESAASNLLADDPNLAKDVFLRDRQAGVTELVSVRSSGSGPGNRESAWPSISADGRYVAFVSYADDLVPGDTNGVTDIFLRDLQTGVTQRVSIDSSGNQANYQSWWPGLSADGRYVAFMSGASNLVTGDTNNNWDIFVHDRQTGGTERVSVDSSGEEAAGYSHYPDISADGTFVAFQSLASNLVLDDSNGNWDIFVHDRQTGGTERVSVDRSGNQGNNESKYPAISADGTFVAFQSLASNLVLDDTNGTLDVFLRARASAPVGGIAELPDLAAVSAHEAAPPTRGSTWSAPDYAALASGIAALLVATAAGAWYTRRRWLRHRA